MAELLETTCVVRTADRYVAHAEIDRQWIDFPRNGSRFWRYGIFQVDQDRSMALIRTNNPVVGDKWNSIQQSDDINGVVLCSPKKVNAFSDFRDDDLAKDFMIKKLSVYGELTDLDVRSVFTIPIKRKPNFFTMPARYAFFSIKTSGDSERLMTSHIGGSAAFGMGLVITDKSKAWEIVSALAESY